MPPLTRLIASLAAMLAFAAALPQINPPGGGGPPGLPSLEHVGIDQKDYQGNVQTTERSIFPTPHPAIEYNQAPGFNVQVSHIAYVKGGSASVKLRVFNRRVNPVSGSLAFTQARLEVPGPNTNPNPQYLPVSLSISGGSFSLQPNGTADLTATISGLPSHVAVGALQVQYNMPLTENPGTPQAVQADNGTQGHWATWERICVLDSIPIGLQAVPWTDFLEYTCRWAYGASGTTQVLSEMTKGIFSGNRCPTDNKLHYLGDSAHYWHLGPTATGDGTYNLSYFLHRINTPGAWFVKSGNCADFAGLLHLALLAHGTVPDCQRFRSELSEKFFTWPLSPAGTVPDVTGLPLGIQHGTFWSQEFRFHVVVRHMGNSIYDASNAYYFGPTGGDWFQPVLGWSSSNFWQKSSQPHWGLAYSKTYPFLFSVDPLGSQSEAVSKIVTAGLVPTAIQ